jgi:hypothetical protein
MLFSTLSLLFTFLSHLYWLDYTRPGLFENILSSWNDYKSCIYRELYPQIFPSLFPPCWMLRFWLPVYYYNAALSPCPGRTTQQYAPGTVCHRWDHGGGQVVQPNLCRLHTSGPDRRRHQEVRGAHRWMGDGKQSMTGGN